MKIYVVGSSGSGKTYFARKLALQCALTHIDVDELWVNRGGKRFYNTPESVLTREKQELRKEISDEIAALCKKERWVIEGNYNFLHMQIAQVADRIIFLDVPPAIAVLNLIKREVIQENRRKGFHFGNFLLLLPTAMAKMRGKRHKLLTVLADYRAKTVVLRSRRDVTNYLDESTAHS